MEKNKSSKEKSNKNKVKKSELKRKQDFEIRLFNLTHFSK